MHLSGLLDLLNQLAPYRELLQEQATGAPIEPLSVLSAAHAYLTAGLKQHSNGSANALILLTARSETAHQLAEQLETWLPPREEGGPPVYLFAQPDALPYERISWSSQTRQQRITALSALQSRTTEQRPVVVASVRALLQKTLPPRDLRLSLRSIKVGNVVRLDQMTLNWVQTGYTHADVVEEPGTFARRGGIVDIWPPNLTRPIRIDLFGDEVDSLRYFDPATQRSEQNVSSVEIGPGSEALSKYGSAALERLGIQGDNLYADENLAIGVEGASPLQDSKLLLAIREQLRSEVSQLAEGHSFHGIEWYLPYFYPQSSSLLDYMDENTLLVLDNEDEIFQTMETLYGEANNLREELMRSGELPTDFLSSAFTPDELRQNLRACHPIILGRGRSSTAQSSENNSALARCFAPGPRYGGQTKPMVRDLGKLKEEGNRVVLLTRQAARVHSLFQEADITAPVSTELTGQSMAGSVSILQHVMSEGFIVRGLETADSSLHFLTDTELFGWSKPQARRKKKNQSTVAPEIFFADVKEGEYVVHLEHGIGTYDGLVKMEVGGVEREYLQVSYAREDKLYVPVHQADRLSRYVGAGESGSPPVTRLGTADWQQVKARAKKAVAEIADDLLKLYAERELVEGYIYSPDGPWQEELEASFPFQETDDQLNAIEAVKIDMESERPMDRLICGDVGYGKTEVAVRAAFKAIMDGKQVAILVPTTVLAQQHYRTFSERLKNFPVNVEMLSRFRTAGQQRKIITKLSEGTVDLVIGTHRMLAKDVMFKDLSLLIIDEEQRFGVSQKERLKLLRTEVDVLTLSATPIPRTLHMSLSGVRDMSTINTPPKERLPVQTVLSEYDDVLVRQAIQRELDRKGQVYVVYNRVRGIKTLADRIQRLVPSANVDVGHGQMAERGLEDVMIRFAEGEVDVLVCTTIIENGLDIPNANTMIIHRSNHFGLAQLYQLRGRVGRSSTRGHCYLLYDKNVTLSFDARRRLSAIIESSEELGAGFRIAMRDLEIRGAGDLLGARQHGQIDTVGFDLYTRLLAQAINEAKLKKEHFEKALEKRQRNDSTDSTEEGKEAAIAEPAVEENLPFDLSDPLAPPVMLDLPLDAQIPDSYIADEGLRLQIYRRVAGLTRSEEIDTMRKELIDRFGTDPETQSVPEPVENLLFQIRIKMLALRAGIQNVGRDLDQISLRSETLENVDRRAMQRRLQLGLGRLDENNELVIDSTIRVGRRAVYLPIDSEGHWRAALVRTLELMAYN